MRITKSYRFGDYRCNSDIGIPLAGTGRLGVPGDRNTLGLGCQLDGLFYGRLGGHLPVSHQDGWCRKQFERFTEASSWDVEEAQHIHLRVHGEGRIQRQRRFRYSGYG